MKGCFLKKRRKTFRFSVKQRLRHLFSFSNKKAVDLIGYGGFSVQYACFSLIVVRVEPMINRREAMGKTNLIFRIAVFQIAKHNHEIIVPADFLEQSTDTFCPSVKGELVKQIFISVV